MNRLLIAFLALAALGCTTPKAVVVDEPRKKPAAVASNASNSNFVRQEIGLREPDVLSELPADNGLRSPASVNPTATDGSPTVIARPPSAPAAGNATTTGTN